MRRLIMAAFVATVLLVASPTSAVAVGVGPAGQSRADLVGAGVRMYAIDANYDMRLWTSNGTTGQLIGGVLAWPAGGMWRGFKSIAVADFNGDSWPDVAGIDANNDMRLYLGSQPGPLSGGAPMWPTGGLWRGFGPISAADYNGDGAADVAGIDAARDLRLYPGDNGRLTGGALAWPGGGLWQGFQGIAADASTPACPVGRVTILPAGDSLTRGDGSSGGDGYRGYLASKLGPGGCRWTYGGAVQGGAGWWSHDGYGGARIDQVAARYPAGLHATAPAGGDAGIVLLGAGTNDADQGLSVAQMLAATDDLLDRVLTPPGVRVLLAQPAAIHRQPAASTLTAYAAALPDLIADRGGRVRLVDMRGVDPGPDGVHPDDAGYQAMATLWYQGLVDAGWWQP